jgi:hypothetical protein
VSWKIPLPSAAWSTRSATSFRSLKSVAKG